MPLNRSRSLLKSVKHWVFQPIIELLDKIEQDDSAIISRALSQKPIMQAGEAYQLIDAMRQAELRQSVGKHQSKQGVIQ